VGFILGIAAQGIERVVEHHAVAQLLVVVHKHPRQAERDRVESGRLRREVEPRGVRATHDDSQPGQRRVVECQCFPMNSSKLHNSPTWLIVKPGMSWRGTRLGGHAQHLARRHVEEFDRRIDEQLDQPGAGDVRVPVERSARCR